MKRYYMLILLLSLNQVVSGMDKEKPQMEAKSEKEDIETKDQQQKQKNSSNTPTPIAGSRVTSNVSSASSPTTSFPILPGSPFRDTNQPSASDERAKKLEDQIRNTLDEYVENGTITNNQSKLIMSTIHVGDKILTDRSDATVHTILNDPYGLKGLYDHFGIKREISPEGSMTYFPSTSSTKKPNSFWERFEEKYNEMDKLVAYNKKGWIVAGTSLAFLTAIGITNLALVVERLYLK